MNIAIRQKIKKWPFILAVLIVGGLIAGFFYFKKPEPVLSLVSVTQGPVAEKAEAVGNIKTRDYSTIKSQVDGIVEEIYHEEGEYVVKNTPLIKIKPAPRPAEYAEAHKNLVNDITLEKHAKTDFDRYQYLVKSGVIAKNDQVYITAKKDYDSANAERVLSEQKWALLTKGETIVDGKATASVVYSPVDGYILYRSVNVGDPVISLSSPQAATTLFIVANMNELIFQGAVDERDAAKLKVGMKAKIKIGSLPDQEIAGTISKIALQSDKENNAVTAPSSSPQNDSSSPFNVGFKIEIGNLNIPKDLVLRSGYSATASVELQKFDNVLTLPMRVIQFKDAKPYVLIPGKKGEKPKEQSVELGISDDITVEVKSGLKLGDQVLEHPDPSILAKDK
ncbi:MAG: efflux RND transporter periplasmic adaptor subunit [Gammaproteobacteria bacterium]|nr:efflux RND transporter periplasmic adaptor subunit [Gammaproteobacteria bacterium]